MSHPLLWTTKKHFQPIGETAALCLTQDLATEQPADILLLGCGDPRYILFTIFSDASMPSASRKLDFTCCDNEPGILARNILLFSLLDDKKHADRVWDIFYHFKIDDQALSIISAQSQRLYDKALNMNTWLKSSYGSFIKFLDLRTLAELRKYWKSYMSFSGLSPKRLEALHEQHAQLSKSVLEKMEFGANASLAAGMLWAKAVPPVKSLFKRYWQTGTILTRESDVQAAKHLNPLFVYSSAGEKFNLHPATFPQGFHLAPAMTPTSPSPKSAPAPGTEAAIIDVMKRQSKEWAEAFTVSRAAGAITLRFFLGDALAFCRSLETMVSTLNLSTGIFASQWRGAQINLGPDLRTTFDVIETSSLTVDLDIHNLLIATCPLLKNDPASQSVLYTEERLSIEEFDTNTPPINRLGTTIPTISALLGLAPRVYLSDFSTYSDIHETLAREHVHRFRERIAWVNPSSGDRYARRQKFVISFDVDDLAQVVYGIYFQMFKREITKIAVVHGNTMPMETPFHYTRETVALLLKYIRRNIHLTGGNWDTFGAKFLELIGHDWSVAAGRTYWLDTCLWLHLADIHTVPSLKSSLVEDDVPPVVCIVLTIPRRRLQPLFAHKDKNCTPVLVAHMQLPNSGSLAYSSIHAIWGKCREISNQAILEEDEKGVEGTSDLVVIFWANSRLLGFEGATIGLSMKSTPHSCFLFREKLGVQGNDLILFSTRTDDIKHVKVYHSRPPILNDPPVAPEDLVNQFIRDVSTKDATLITANIGGGSDSRAVVSLTARVKIESPAEQGVLLDGAEVKASQVSPCTMKLEIGDYEHMVSYPYPIQGGGYKLRVARKSHYVEVIVPFSKPLDNTGYHLDKTPILQNDNPSPWNIPHINSDRMPLLNVNDPKKLDWLKTQNDLQHSVRERHVLKKHDPAELALPINNWVDTKNTIRTLIMYAAGIGNMVNRVFTLSESGIVYAVILVAGLRFDLASFTVFLDAALIPSATEGMPPLFSSIRTLQNAGRLIQITTSEQETLAWKKLFPVFAERCRTWSHNTNCEYAAQGEIPLSTKSNRSPICSCGQGVGFKGSEWNNASWKGLLTFATRVAICQLFAVTCSEIKSPEQSGAEDNFIPPQRRTDKTCWVCGSSGKPGLLSCSGCKRAKYCSGECQKLDWKMHKKICGK